MHLSFHSAIRDGFRAVRHLAGPDAPLRLRRLRLLEVDEDGHVPALGKRLVIDERVVRPPIGPADHDILADVLLARLELEGLVVEREVEAEPAYRRSLLSRSRRRWTPPLTSG